jgi:hypothetical protein
MNDSSSSREAILRNVLLFLPDAKVEHPRIPSFARKSHSFKADFELHLQEAGGAAHDVPSAALAQAKLTELHPGAKSSVPLRRRYRARGMSARSMIRTNLPTSTSELFVLDLESPRAGPSG